MLRNEYDDDDSPQEVIDNLGSETSLDLSQMELTSEQLKDLIKKNFDVFQGLKEINLGGNNITELPEEIFALTNLKKLGLDSNQIATIPNRITELKNLSELDLMGNKLTKVPEIMAEMNKLKYLKLEANQIEKIPNSLLLSPRDTKERRTIYLFGNPIKSFEEAVRYAEEKLAQGQFLSDVKLNQDVSIIDNEEDENITSETDFNTNIEGFDFGGFADFKNLMNSANVNFQLRKILDNDEKSKDIQLKIKGTGFEDFLLKMHLTNHWSMCNPQTEKLTRQILAYCLTNEETFNKTLPIAAAYAQDCVDTTSAGLLEMKNIVQEVGNAERLKKCSAKELCNFYRQPALEKMIMDFVAKKTKGNKDIDLMEEYLNFVKSVGRYIGISSATEIQYSQHNYLSRNPTILNEFLQPLFKTGENRVDPKKIDTVIADYLINNKDYILDQNENIAPVISPIKDSADEAMHLLYDRKNSLNDQEYNQRCNKIKNNMKESIKNKLLEQINPEYVQESFLVKPPSQKRIRITTNDDEKERY